MKIVINQPDEEKLIAISNEITGIVEKITSAQAELAVMQKELPQYRDALADLEINTSHRDEKAVSAVITKRAQCELIERKIPRVQDIINTLPNLLHSRIGDARSLILVATTPALENLKKEVTATLRPHYGDGKGLERVVNDAPIVVSFENFFWRTYSGSPTNAVAYAPQVLEMLHELITGDTTWTFTAK